MGHHRPDDRTLTADHHRLIESVIPLVWQQANRHKRALRMDATDVAGEYFLALSESVFRYDPTRSKYTTYAMWIIRGRRSLLALRRDRDSRLKVCRFDSRHDDDTGSGHPVGYDAPPTYDVLESVAVEVGPDAMEMLNYRYRDGMTYMEIAGRLGVSSKTSRVMMHGIMRKLRVNKKLRSMADVGHDETCVEGGGKDG